MSNKQELIELSLTPDEASRIIHSHRKVRYGKCPPSNLSISSPDFGIFSKLVDSYETQAAFLPNRGFWLMRLRRDRLLAMSAAKSKV